MQGLGCGRMPRGTAGSVGVAGIHTFAMGQPWGLSGPEFLGVYGAGMAVMIVVSLFVRQLVRVSPGGGRGVLAGQELDAYQAGYLAGGAERVAQVIVAEWTESGALRVNSEGRISVTDRGLAGTSPAVARYGVRLDGVPDGARTDSVLKAVARDAGVSSIGRGLRKTGLAVTETRVHVLRLVTIALVVILLGAGIARFIEAAHNHRPAGTLTVLFVFSIVIGFILIVSTWAPPVATTAGARYLRELRPQWQNAVLPAFAGPGGETALFGVALLGFAAISDTDLRAGLQAGIPSSSSSGGSSCSSGSSCGGGCGGGGCGG
jgi:uncharacterized protein (TIGR04222 family)